MAVSKSLKLKERRSLFCFLAGIICMGSGFSASGFCKSRSLLDKLVLYPSTEEIAPTSGKRRVLPSGLEVWIHHRPAKNQMNSSAQKLYLVHFIGNNSRAEIEEPDPDLLDLFPSEFDIKSWSVNYRGFGGSSGVATLDSLPETGLEAFDAVSQEAGTSPVVISGFSLGTTVALYLALNRNAAGLILRNPVPLREMILGEYGWWNLWMVAGPVSLQVPKELGSVKNAAQAKLPALIMSSENDTMVPRKYQDKIINKYAGPMYQVLLKNCDHGDPIPESAFESIRISLKKMLSKNLILRSPP